MKPAPAPTAARRNPVVGPCLASEAAGAGPCIHHWLIDPPNGPTCPAVCKRCGAERVFAATLENDFGHNLLPPRDAQLGSAWKIWD